MQEPSEDGGSSAAKPLATPRVSGVRGPSLRRLQAPIVRAALIVAAIWFFILALQMIRDGALGLRPVLDAIQVTGITGHFGFGWFGSYVVMSGSPVAAVSMSLFAGGAITDLEAFSMINGTRMGASLIVLVVGFVSYVTGRRNPDGLYIGVVALLTAITLWGPAMPLGLLILDRGWLDGVHIQSPGLLMDFVDYTSEPIIERLNQWLPDILLFLGGVGTLMAGFTLFDRALPNLERPGRRFEALSRVLHQRFAMFGFGTLVTLITMSVSLSVTILVPLALKGYIRRDRVIPYVMGANIATWIDTLFAALLLDSPRAFTIVLTEMLVGGAVSMTALLLLYGPYTALVLTVAHKVSSSRRHMAAFIACLFFMPVVFIVI